MDNNTHNFTKNHYKYILEIALEKKYHFNLFTNKEENRFEIYLRHDVDNSIHDAYELAMIENQFGIQSTYLFMLRSENYNVLSHENIALINQISSMGHDIGLHFILNEDYLPINDNELKKLIKEDALSLSEIIGLDINVFSFHNPTGKDQYKIDVPNLVNTYNINYFKKIKYMSESNMMWKEGCPCKIINDKKYEKMQILIHPLSYASNLKNDADVLKYFLFNRLNQLKNINEEENLNLKNNRLSIEELTDYFLKEDRKDEK